MYKLYGKVNIIKCVAFPKILFVASFLQSPPDFITKLNKIFFSFIWGNREKVKRSKIYLSKAEGGLSMIDLKTHILSMKAVWAHRLIKSRDELWCVVFKEHIKQSRLEFETTFNTSFDKISLFPKLSKNTSFLSRSNHFL